MKSSCDINMRCKGSPEKIVKCCCRSQEVKGPLRQTPAGQHSARVPVEATARSGPDFGRVTTGLGALVSALALVLPKVELFRGGMHIRNVEASSGQELNDSLAGRNRLSQALCPHAQVVREGPRTKRLGDSPSTEPPLFKIAQPPGLEGMITASPSTDGVIAQIFR